jgi:hypothetical protein
MENLVLLQERGIERRERDERWRRRQEGDQRWGIRFCCERERLRREREGLDGEEKKMIKIKIIIFN